MQIFKIKTAARLFISLVLILALSITTEAQQKTKAAGKMTAAYTDQEMIEVGDVEGHVITLVESEGINVSTGKPAFMDGSQLINLSFGDYVKGSGLHQGYVKLTKKDDTAIAKWQGKVTTTLSAEGVPVTTFEGTFSWIKGTGQFEGIQGNGTYKGAFISKTIYTVDWEGEYSIQK